MSTLRPLSPAAQAVLDRVAEQVLADRRCHMQHITAAIIRALVEQTLPAEEPIRGGMRPGGTHPVTSDEFKQIQRQRTRANQLALAAELNGEAPQPTPTETT